MFFKKTAYKPQDARKIKIIFAIKKVYKYIYINISEKHLQVRIYHMTIQQKENANQLKFINQY